MCIILLLTKEIEIREMFNFHTKNISYEWLFFRKLLFIADDYIQTSKLLEL